MPLHSKRSILTFTAAFSLASGVPLALQQPPDVASASERRSRCAGVVFEPPVLPASSDAIPPLTLTVTTTLKRAASNIRITRQTVLRTADRMLVVTDDTQTEWLFERNPVDHRRVAGYLIDHKTKRILIHQERDLRNLQHVCGWLDVLTLRFDRDSLQTMRHTSETHTVSGMSFDRLVAKEPPRSDLTEVWWNEALLLPALVVARESSTLTIAAIERIHEGVDTSRLAPPAQRFPSYRALEVTGAREP